MSDAPTARVLRLTPNRSFPGSQIAVIVCPYCVKRRSFKPLTHVHGVPEGSTGWEYRAPHCRPADLARAGITQRPSDYRFDPAGAQA